MLCFVRASSWKFAPNYVCHSCVSPHILFVQDPDRNIICPSTGFICIQLYIYIYIFYFTYIIYSVDIFINVHSSFWLSWGWHKKRVISLRSGEGLGQNPGGFEVAGELKVPEDLLAANMGTLAGKL